MKSPTKLDTILDDFDDKASKLVNIGDYPKAKQEAVQAIEAYIAEREKIAFRNGQLDCQKAGDPSNHVFFAEAVDHLSKKDNIEVNIERQGVDIGDRDEI